jgi:hypothetical protein
MDGRFGLCTLGRVLKQKNPAQGPGFVVRCCTNARDCLPGRISALGSARARSHPRGRAGAGEDDRLDEWRKRHGEAIQ